MAKILNQTKAMLSISKGMLRELKRLSHQIPLNPLWQGEMPLFGHQDLGHWNLFRASCLGFRI
jgi:hypothetical protein